MTNLSASQREYERIFFYDSTMAMGRKIQEPFFVSRYTKIMDDIIEISGLT
jgi:hypothetical protein